MLSSPFPTLKNNKCCADKALEDVVLISALFKMIIKKKVHAHPCPNCNLNSSVVIEISEI